MIVENVVPKDIEAKLSFTVTQINYILQFLDNCTVKYNPETDEPSANAVAYVENTLFPSLDKLYDEIKKGLK